MYGLFIWTQYFLFCSVVLPLQQVLFGCCGIKIFYYIPLSQLKALTAI